jgi:hypothetical protein
MDGRDASAQGLRVAWDADELSAFHGWNKGPGEGRGCLGLAFPLG